MLFSKYIFYSISFTSVVVLAAPFPIDLDSKSSNCPDPVKRNEFIKTSQYLEKEPSLPEQLAKKCDAKSEPNSPSNSYVGGFTFGVLGSKAAWDTLVDPRLPGPMRDGVRLPRKLTPITYSKLTPEQAARLSFHDVQSTFDLAAAKNINPKALAFMPFDSLTAINEVTAAGLPPEAIEALKFELHRPGSVLQNEALGYELKVVREFSPWLERLMPDVIPVR
ncbi:MAG: hypothetical protein M1829_006065 [Trizodia sp. TS-e1964]|nr:MAG: hypothetical protein M1829_006065 [Trizodia sp. TS-e1964]